VKYRLSVILSFDLFCKKSPKDEALHQQTPRLIFMLRYNTYTGALWEEFHL